MDHSDPPQRLVVPAHLDGQRLDRILAELLPEHSRARLQDWIRAGQVEVAGQMLAPKARVAAGVQIALTEPPAAQETAIEPQAIPLEVVFEDDQLIVINKAAGISMHPGAGRADGTIQNALLHYRPSLASVPRAGIVHRLDLDTSGLFVVAATQVAHTALVRDLAERRISREYLALVRGQIIAGGTVDAPIGRDPRERKKMAVVGNGRPAVTHYRVEQRFSRATLLRIRLETGRTHQIRVHMKQLGYPLAGDRQYGSRADPWRQKIGRQALHAWRLGLTHPSGGDDLEWQVDPPADMQALIDELQDAEPG